MDLATIEMPRVEARKAYLEYRDAIRVQQVEELDEVQRRQLAQDRAIAQAYKALSTGNQLIQLEPTIVSAGFDEQGRPKLALCRADADECYMDRRRSGQIEYRRSEDAHTNRTANGARVRVNGPAWAEGAWHVEAVATLPNIPPALRPRHHLRNYHLLWEAEWRNVRSSRRQAPRDPALLKHLGGDLWAVLGVWDLTDVERAALESGRVA